MLRHLWACKVTLTHLLCVVPLTRVHGVLTDDSCYPVPSTMRCFTHSWLIQWGLWLVDHCGGWLTFPHIPPPVTQHASAPTNSWEEMSISETKAWVICGTQRMVTSTPVTCRWGLLAGKAHLRLRWISLGISGSLCYCLLILYLWWTTAALKHVYICFLRTQTQNIVHKRWVPAYEVNHSGDFVGNIDPFLYWFIFTFDRKMDEVSSLPL